MRTFGRHGTYSIPQSSLISNISKKIVSTDLDSKLTRIEHEKDVSIRESSEAGSGYQPVITEKMKNMTTDEIFERLVKENIDFRDYRYNELIQQFEDEMDEFKKTAPNFDELTEANAMQVQQMNSAQVYSQLQSKFYTLRKRDKDDLQERYDRVMKVVRSSHVQEVQNLVSKFKGVLKETIEKKLDEQKLKYELEHKEMRDSFFTMKAQIRNLEDKCESLQEKINDKDKKLQETYDKIMKMNSENSFKNADQEKLQKMIKEKDVQIEKLLKSEKALEALEKQKVDYALLLKEKDNTINQKEQLIQKLQKQISQQTSKLTDQDQKIRTLEQQESNKVQSKTTIVSEEEQVDPNSKRRLTPENYQICRQALSRNDSKSGQNTSNAKSRPVKQQSLKQQVPIQNFGDIKYKQSKRDETLSTKQFIDQLQQKIKLKEDQIKLLTNEVMGLREESDTYLQNLQTIQQQTQQSHLSSKTQGFLSSTPAPNLNDLILDPYRRVESSANKSRLSMTEDSRYLQSVFSKNASQFNNAVISPKLLQLQSASSRNRNLSNNNTNNAENKENFPKSAVMNTTDVSIYKTTIKTPQSGTGNRQSLMNITNKATTPDPAKKFCDIQVSYFQNNNNNNGNTTPNVQSKTRVAQVQTVYQNTNLLQANTTNSQYFNQNSNNSTQMLFTQVATPQIGNKSVHISNFNSANINSSNSINMVQSPTLINTNTQNPKQKRLLGSYRVQPNFTPQQQSLNNNYVSSASDSFIPLNL